MKAKEAVAKIRARGGEVLAVRDERAFRRPGGSRGVDDERARRRIDFLRKRFERVDGSLAARNPQIVERREQRIPELGAGRSILIDTAEARFGGRDSRPLGPYQAILYE